MAIIKTKPLSVNDAWQGRRFKTPEYKTYEWELFSKLKPIDLPKGKLSLFITFYLSNKLSDIDNPLKPFLDILQKKYQFNDRDIYEMRIVKKIVKKGEEGIDFDIKEYE
mgnify:CR=1 FL=1|tara:strand:- start:421 stop:747 length:327 start_codon:yes stop_codon:yes gene_type:complete